MTTPATNDIVKALHEWMDDLEAADQESSDAYSRIGCLIAWIEGHHPTYRRDAAARAGAGC